MTYTETKFTKSLVLIILGVIDMNKMKSIIMAVLVLVFAGFSLHAETKIKENKLTNRGYVKKICNITSMYKREDYYYYDLDNGKGCYVTYNGNIACVLVRNGELYGRMFSVDGGINVSYNMHDELCHTNVKIDDEIDDELRQEVTSIMRTQLIDIADDLGLMSYIKE